MVGLVTCARTVENIRYGTRKVVRVLMIVKVQQDLWLHQGEEETMNLEPVVAAGKGCKIRQAVGQQMSEIGVVKMKIRMRRWGQMAAKHQPEVGTK